MLYETPANSTKHTANRRGMHRNDGWWWICTGWSRWYEAVRLLICSQSSYRNVMFNNWSWNLVISFASFHIRWIDAIKQRLYKWHTLHRLLDLGHRKSNTLCQSSIYSCLLNFSHLDSFFLFSLLFSLSLSVCVSMFDDDSYTAEFWWLISFVV